MNRIIIVGNGFDLHNGLPTDYKSFIYWYLRKNLLDAIQKPIDNILIQIPKLQDNQLLYANNLQAHNTDEILKILIETGGLSKPGFPPEDTIRIKSTILIKTITQIENYGWADIEQVYYKLLVDCLLNTNISKSIEQITRLNNSFEALRKELISYLIDFGNHDGDYFVNISSNIIDLNDFRIRDKTKIGANAKKVDSDFFFGNNLFVNFNYTNYWIENTVKSFNNNSLVDVISIHGDLNNFRNKPFFGYGDDVDENYKRLEAIVNSDEWSKYFKTIFYQETDNYKSILDFADAGPFQTVIVGHSCGLSDRTLLNTIFEHNNCKCIKPYYFKNPETEKDNWHSLMTNISRIFKDKSKMRVRNE